MKLCLVATIQYAVDSGIAKARVCLLLQIEIRRIQRWEQRQKETGSMNYRRPGPEKGMHALMPAEKLAIIAYVGQEQTSDMSLQQLSHTGREKGVFCVSASGVRSILLANGLVTQRNEKRYGTGTSLPPARPAELTGPNMCWTWDISYLLTTVHRMFYYLYVMLDEWSRKAVAWQVTYTLEAAEAKQLISTAVLSEGLLDVPCEQRPVIVNDRGKQMKATSVKTMLADLHMPQIFARPHTPDDNPFIESLFGTIKSAPSWPNRFPANDIIFVRSYFDNYFHWYNTQHFHSGIQYLHPADKHAGLEEQIIRERESQLTNQRNARKMYWLNQKLTGSSL